jgi:hypothetical protein
MTPYDRLCDLIELGWSMNIVNLVDRSGPGGGPGVPAVSIYLRKVHGPVLVTTKPDLFAAIEDIHDQALRFGAEAVSC